MRTADVMIGWQHALYSETTMQVSAAYSLSTALALTGLLPGVSLSPFGRRAWRTSWRSPSAASSPILTFYRRDILILVFTGRPFWTSWRRSLGTWTRSSVKFWVLFFSPRIHGISLHHVLRPSYAFIVYIFKLVLKYASALAE